MKNKPISEKVIICDKCHAPLWRLRNLSEYSHEYVAIDPAANPTGPKTFQCPKCSRDFASEVKTPNGKGRFLTFWNEEKQERETHMI